MASELTNIHNLPEVFVNAVKVDRHRVNGDISVTQLIDAPQVRRLRMKHGTKDDVMDRIYMLDGTAIHHVLELSEITSTEARILTQAQAVLEHLGKHKGVSSLQRIIDENYAEAFNPDVIVEKTMTVQVGGWTISGTVDRTLIKEGAVEDYKNTSVYAFMNPEAQKKYIPQLNIYAYMAEKELGIEIKTLRVIFKFRDWSKGKAATSKNYPKAPVILVNIPRRTNEQVEAYLEKRVALHQASDKGEIIACSPKERWSEPDQYAVKKKGAVRATKKFTKKPEAELYKKLNQHKHAKTGGLIVETRKGGSRRCADFCAVAYCCPQRKSELAEAIDAEM